MSLLINIIRYTTLALSFILLPLILVIMISWNALPNSQFYPLKRGLEQITLNFLAVNNSWEIQFHGQLLERRYKEMDILINQGSNQGIVEFMNEVKAVKVSILNNKSKNPQQKSEQSE